MPDPTPAEPQGVLDKLGAALPVALAAVATAFAGMSSSEMARAMFWRSAAAQDQAKAASQWTLAGFKKDRALIVSTTAATLRRPTDRLPPAGPPDPGLPPPADERIRAVLDGMRQKLPEGDLVARAGAVPLPAIDDAIREAEVTADKLEAEWDGGPAGTVVERFDADARRYNAEAKRNQAVSQLYEVRVRVTTAASERHRKRSEHFFYAMLAGQVGATVGSLALARKRRSGLWAVAGLAGLASVGYGAYVYLLH